MKKQIYLLLGILVIAFASCDKGDLEIKRLTRGEGTWVIESVKYDTFDVSGSTVVGSYTWDNPGELVFFESPTLNALFSHHMVVALMNDTSGAVIANPGRVFYDGDRVYFGEDPDPEHNFPNEFEGIWTIIDDGRKKQVWTQYSMNGATGLVEVKSTINMKKK